MIKRTDVIVIGAGPNGLVCAGMLARSGLNVVCVDAAKIPGGMSAPRTLGDGYHFPGLTHTAFPLSPAIRKKLRLDEFGYRPGDAIDTVALDRDGQHLTISAGVASGNELPARCC